jgi:hypothetical protein
MPVLVLKQLRTHLAGACSLPHLSRDVRRAGKITHRAALVRTRQTRSSAQPGATTALLAAFERLDAALAAWGMVVPPLAAAEEGPDEQAAPKRRRLRRADGAATGQPMAGAEVSKQCTLAGKKKNRGSASGAAQAAALHLVAAGRRAAGGGVAGVAARRLLSGAGKRGVAKRSNRRG